MEKPFVAPIILALAIICATALSQPAEEAEPLAARLTVLEQSFASLETRFELMAAQVPTRWNVADLGSTAVSVDLSALRRDVDRLNTELVRLRRLAETAQRAASDAKRDAAAAERLARQVENRIR